MAAEPFTPCHALAAQLEKRGRALSKELAAETEQEKIYILLLAWGVEYLKLQQRVI